MAYEQAKPMNDEIAVSIHRSIQAGVLPDLQKHLEQVKDLSSTDLLVAPNRHGDSAFHVAARCGHVMLLRRLHEEHGVPLNLVNSDGKWALHEAAQNKRKDCVEYLVSAGMPIDCLKRADWSVKWVVILIIIIISNLFHQDSSYARLCQR